MKGCLLCAFVVALFLSLIQARLLCHDASSFSLQISMNASVHGNAVLYVDTGAGFSEVETARSSVKGDGQFHAYPFSLPVKTIYNFRFDPLATDGSVSINDIQVVDGFGKSISSVNLGALRPAHQIQSFDLKDNILNITIEKHADDPQIILSLESPLIITSYFKSNIWLILIRFLGGFLVFFSFSILLIWMLRRKGNSSILFNEMDPNRDRIVLSRRFRIPMLREFFSFSDKQFFVFIAAFLFLSYIWFASAGTMSKFPTKTYLLEMQADAFRHGQTSLLVKPAPELLRADNPYDHAYQKFWLWDAIYFHGKYYTYWGPVPALFVAVVKSLTGLRSLSDQYPCLFFSLARLALSLTLIWQAWCLFGRRNPWVLAACGLVIALANPFPYLLSLADVYATPILAGQAFSLAGLSLALHAITGGKGRKAILVAAGCCWALAFGSRLALLPALSFLAVITALAIASQMGRVWWQGFIGALLSLAAPMLLGLVLLGWYNWIRFGDPFETGLYYQLTLLTLTKMMNAGYVAINSYLYWLKPPDFIGQFPFLFVLENPAPPIPWFVASPPMPYYLKEPIAGIPWMQPFAVYALLAVQYAWAEKARIFHTFLSPSPSTANSLALGC